MTPLTDLLTDMLISLSAAATLYSTALLVWSVWDARRDGAPRP